MISEFTKNEPTYPALDAEWVPHLQALHRYFFETAADACVLWVDPAQGDPFDGNALVEARRIRVPIMHPRFDMQFAPYLVPLDLSRSADADVFRRSVQLGWEAWQHDHLAAAKGQPISGWIRGAMEPVVLARHWARNCYLHVQGGLHKLLRLHDPGVREWLWLELDANQKRQLLGTALTLISFCRTRQLQYHEPDSGANMDPNTLHRLVLSAEQWARVDDYAIVHAAWLSDPSGHAAAGFDASVRTFDPRPILSALGQATRYGIHDAEDRTLFARHALVMGPEFHTDERLQDVWKLTIGGEFYGGAVEEIIGLPVDSLAGYLSRQSA